MVNVLRLSTSFYKTIPAVCFLPHFLHQFLKPSAEQNNKHRNAEGSLLWRSPYCTPKRWTRNQKMVSSFFPLACHQSVVPKNSTSNEGHGGENGVARQAKVSWDWILLEWSERLVCKWFFFEKVSKLKFLSSIDFKWSWGPYFQLLTKERHFSEIVWHQFKKNIQTKSNKWQHIITLYHNICSQCHSQESRKLPFSSLTFATSFIFP